MLKKHAYAMCDINQSTNTTGDDTGTQPPPPGDTGANNSALTEQAAPSVPRPTVEATYDVVTKGSSDNESDNTEPGWLNVVLEYICAF